jgi:hypothetical protein
MSSSNDKKSHNDGGGGLLKKAFDSLRRNTKNSVNVKQGGKEAARLINDTKLSTVHTVSSTLRNLEQASFVEMARKCKTAKAAAKKAASMLLLKLQRTPKKRYAEYSLVLAPPALTLGMSFALKANTNKPGIFPRFSNSNKTAMCLSLIGSFAISYAIQRNSAGVAYASEL